MQKPNFKEMVYEVVAQIPKGKVMTYGDIAAYCGSASSARIVGGLAHFGPTDLQWHRVVNRFGGLAAGYYGGKLGHQKALEDEGFVIENLKIVDFDKRRWTPISR
ncbi:hypothetical protein A3F64_00555 [Candidatus Saccharibacteria bacterium RIFCSPHIGHO2_12_FULL_42_8]|nr:MAG: hypothetical protein A3F64_00555 [Candidatus Saccharibacteria bacterium RIFCSPHIGHO2_12_FULL_42_8]